MANQWITVNMINTIKCQKWIRNRITGKWQKKKKKKRMGEGQEILSNKKKGLGSLSLFSSCSGPAVLGLISALDVKPERCWASPEQFLRICWVFFVFFLVLSRDMVKWKIQQETLLLYKQAEGERKDWSLTAKHSNRKHVTISAFKRRGKRRGPRYKHPRNMSPDCYRCVSNYEHL